MQKMVFVAAIAAGIAGLSGLAFAEMMMPDALGPVHMMKMKGHMVHMQVVKNKAGDKFVVIPMADAEMMMGKIAFDPVPYTFGGGQ